MLVPSVSGVAPGFSPAMEFLRFFARLHMRNYATELISIDEVALCVYY
jgi:hypothetical protein